MFFLRLPNRLFDSVFVHCLAGLQYLTQAASQCRQPNGLVHSVLLLPVPRYFRAFSHVRKILQEHLDRTSREAPNMLCFHLVSAVALTLLGPGAHASEDQLSSGGGQATSWR